MAEETPSYLDKYTLKGTLTDKKKEPDYLDKYLSSAESTGDTPDYLLKYGGRLSSKQLQTSAGLYELARRSGLQKEADRILQRQQGENKEIFSGGFISDIFDTLNALDYGVVGLLKGKGFMEGVKTRQSFSDKDALGNFGIPGMVLGIALDIAVDPLTYIAPTTIIKHFPGATKVLKLAKTAAFGEMVEKTVDVAGEGTKAFQQLEGGSKAGKWLADKFVWMFGADPVYRNLYERSMTNTAIGTQNIANLAKGISALGDDVGKQLLTKDETGRFIRKSAEELSGILKPEEFARVESAWNKIDELGKEAVDLKILSKEKYEENIGEYIKNAYLEYEKAKGGGVFSFLKTGVKGIKKRVEGLTDEEMLKLGKIENPAYLMFKSAFDLHRDIENVKFFNQVSEKFGTDVAQEGFKQLPTTRRLFTSSTGEKLEMLGQIRKLNGDMSPLFGQLKKTFQANKATLSQIGKMEKDLGELSKLRVEEFNKFFAEGAEKVTEGATKIRTIPDELIGMAEDVKKFSNVDEMLASKTGTQVEKLYVDGVLQRRGFTSIDDFFKAAKEPFTKTAGGKVVPELEDMQKLINLQKTIEELMPKLDNIQGIDKTSINDSFRFLEDSINKINMEKEKIFQNIDKVKLGELSGKWVPENVFNSLQEMTDPIKNGFGSKVVAGFKFGKVVMNPATHARNVISNTVLNWWKLGIGPWRADLYGTALKEVTKGGKWADEAATVGFGLDTFAANEIKALMDSPEALGFGSKLGNTWASITNRVGDIYQKEEGIAKMAAFIGQRQRGFSIEEAWKAAESATFNYSQVTPFIRKLRSSLFGFPFITFTAKATPVAVETALKHPGRISAIGKIKNTIEELTDTKETERERKSEPAYIKDGFYVKLPIKDKHGRSAYFDLTYILPFGDIMSGQFFNRGQNRESGLPESHAQALLSNAPFLNFIKEVSKNQDFYGDKIWQESDSTDKQLGDLMRHVSKTYLPPLIADQIPGGYQKGKERRQKGIQGAMNASDENQQRTLMQEMMRNVGIKIQPINLDMQESMHEYNTKKALETMLMEGGVGANFNRFYVPKK